MEKLLWSIGVYTMSCICESLVFLSKWTITNSLSNVVLRYVTEFLGGGGVMIRYIFSKIKTINKDFYNP